MAVQIESAVYESFGDDEKKYQNKFRSLYSNLKDVDNQGLRNALFSGSLDVRQLIQMSHEVCVHQRFPLNAATANQAFIRSSRNWPIPNYKRSGGYCRNIKYRPVKITRGLPHAPCLCAESVGKTKLHTFNFRHGLPMSR